MKKICHFGIFKPTYIRNKVLARGFEAHGYAVVTCVVDPTEVGGVRKFWHLYKKYKALEDKNFEYVIVGYPGQSVVWLAYLLFGKDIIFDAFLSLYDSNVFDRKLHSKYSVKGMRDWVYDWYSTALARKVLLPENVQIEYFVRTFGTKRSKLIRVFTGADDSNFYPRPECKKADEFTVHFHGNFIPLQGVEYIVDAAQVLKNESIRFQIIGAGGALFETFKNKISSLKLENIEVLGRKPLAEVPEYIARSHVCLGVFGDSDKAKRVISNKVYEYIAMGMPVITARTPAMQELFEDGKNILFCNSADGEDMAGKILILKKDEGLRQKIAKNGYTTYTERVSPPTLVEQLLKDIAV